jgi:hypothetical protein
VKEEDERHTNGIGIDAILWPSMVSSDQISTSFGRCRATRMPMQDTTFDDDD